MKKYSMRLAAAIMAVVMVMSMTVGCGSKKEAEAAPLNLFIWTEYVPESVIEGFTEETGIKVNVSYYSSNEDLYSKLSSESEGTYDIVQPSDYMVEKLIAQDMLEPLDTSKLTNLSNIGAEYLDRTFDPGNKYSVPYMGGVAAIAVNTSTVSKEITSYDDLFDPAFAGKEVVLDDSRAVIGMAAKTLGYSMSTTDTTELAKVKDKLLSLKDNVQVYDSDSPKSVMISGDCDLGMMWNAEIALAAEENPDIKIVYPSEGAYLFLDSFCIPKGAKNTDAAVKFIDYMLSAKASAACSEELPYLNPNTEACKILGDDYLNNEAKNVPADVIDAGEYIHNLDPDTQAVYEEMWTELKK